MNPMQARQEFEKFVTEAGAFVSDFKPIDAVRLMLDFYQQERAAGCSLKSDGDMLLFQWGMAGRFFKFNLTRQFVDAETEDSDHQIQLSLSCHFTPTPDLKTIKPVSKWCARPEELGSFEYFISKCPAFQVIGKLRPENVALTCEAV